jgi:hypothetical protein
MAAGRWTMGRVSPAGSNEEEGYQERMSRRILVKL